MEYYPKQIVLVVKTETCGEDKHYSENECVCIINFVEFIPALFRNPFTMLDPLNPCLHLLGAMTASAIQKAGVIFVLRLDFSL